MSKQYGDLVDWDASQQHFHSKGIAEHVRETSLCRSIRLSRPASAKRRRKLRASRRLLILAVRSSPEKVPRVWLGAIWNAAQRFSYLRRQRNVDWRSGLRLIDVRSSPMRRVLSRVVAARIRKPLHRIRRVSDRSEYCCGPCLPAIFAVRIRCINGLSNSLRVECVRRRLIDGDTAQAMCRVLSNPSSTNAEPEESGQAFLLLLS